MDVILRLQPFGVDLFCLGKKFLVFNMVSRNLKIKYRRSILGIFWTLLSPMAMAMVYYFVFKLVLNVKVPHYLPFILSGVLPWAFFSQSLIEGLESIVVNWGLISKVPIPIQVFPFVGTLTNLVTLCLGLPIVIGIAVVSGVNLGASLLLLPFYFFALFILTYSFALVLSVFYVYFRDLKHIMSIVVQLWFYATPVIYDEKMIPGKYQWILYLNPLGTVFTGLHQVLVKGMWPGISAVAISCAWVLAVLLVTVWTQKNLCREIVEQI